MSDSWETVITYHRDRHGWDVELAQCSDERCRRYVQAAEETVREGDRRWAEDL